jgi:hypothetical protein
MICSVPITNFCDKRSRVCVQRMKEDSVAVDDQTLFSKLLHVASGATID